MSKLKAYELMLGDWVLVNSIPMQIQAINDIDGEIMAGDELYCLIEDRVHSEDKIEPIPLTAELLEKNGFQYYHKNYASLSYGHPLQIAMDRWPDENGLNGLWRIGSIIEIRYVHELQHALRLCGIDKEIVL